MCSIIVILSSKNKRASLLNRLGLEPVDMDLNNGQNTIDATILMSKLETKKLKSYRDLDNSKYNAALNFTTVKSTNKVTSFSDPNLEN